MRRHYVVSGRVQGVGFRQFTAEKAQRLNLSGWVRNLPDGNVEAEAQASAEALDAFEKFLRQGPSYGRVDRLLVDELPDLDSLPAIFEIRR